MTIGNMRGNSVGTQSTDHMLTLNRASKHRPGGPWSADDYDVFDGEQHSGRTMWAHAASRDTPWFWTITARIPQYPHDRGTAVARSNGATLMSSVFALYRTTIDLEWQHLE
jgi:hypothetical protein